MDLQDIHIHTLWSDGFASIEEIIQKAIASRLVRIGISDHYEKIKDFNGYRAEISTYEKSDYPISVLAGIEIKISTLLELEDSILSNITRKLDYILIEDLEYRANIIETLLQLQQSVLPLISPNCKKGWAHLNLNKLGGFRKEVIEFSKVNKMFIDFNTAEPFYQDVLQGNEDIDDLCASNIVMLVGSDTHDIDNDWIPSIEGATAFINAEK